ncbi:NAD(P)-dependent oxidoreductase [Flavobacteriaceae bacterium]|nr:NAD(P)-dependent oxidoreductase [Flavobacteriaceae bacterium]
MKFDYNKVFITGGNGWLGKTLINTLINGDKLVIENLKVENIKIISLDLIPVVFEKSFNNNKVEYIKGDIRSKNDCDLFFKNINSKSVLFHCAGIIHPKKVSDFFEINYDGTRNLIEKAISKGINKIVVISSNSPIGCNKSNDYLFDEKSKYNPYMNYGKSKMLMEQFLMSKIKEGIDITIIRPPWFYGENMPSRQLTFYKMVKEGKFPMIGNGRNIRSKANVKNIVQGMILSSIVEKSKGEIYWIADEKPYTMKEIIYTVSEVLEREFGIVCKENHFKFPFLTGQLFQLLDFLLQKIDVYNQKIHVASELNKNIGCSIQKAKDELGYNPKVSLYDGIKFSLSEIDVKTILNE